MDNGTAIIKYGHVESVYDDSFGLRIKARIDQDGNRKTSEIPFAFPLLPKAFQVIPKEGEGVIIVTSLAGSSESQRFYIGPLISQPQYNELCNYDYGRGPAASLFGQGLVEPLETIKNFDDTEGSFPNEAPTKFKDDVAIVGRNTQDVIMRHNPDKDSDEIDIRCGVRSLPLKSSNNLIGKVIFNSVDPAYIQLKYKKAITNGENLDANSVINVVADKINIISTKDDNGFNLGDPQEMIKSEELNGIMEKLHQLPHGDTLVEFINIFKTAFLRHSHPHNGMPPTQGPDVLNFGRYDINKILSKHVRIS